MSRKLAPPKANRPRRTSKPLASASFKTPTSAQRVRYFLSCSERQIVKKNLAEIGVWCAENDMALQTVVILGDLNVLIFDEACDAAAFKQRWF